jgi:hypothetical protein
VRLRVAATIVLLLAALAAGCVTTYQEEDLEDRLERLASATRGLRRPRAFAIHADTRMAALVLLAEARASRDSALSVALRSSLAAAQQQRRDLVAGGPFPDLTDQVLRNALELQPESGLPGLQLLVASAEPPSAELLGAARRARVRLFHRDLR